MKIIVKNADFSGIKIGVSVTVPDVLKPAVNAFGNLSDSDTSALVTLYNSLVSGGYWDRIEKLYIPGIAPSLDVTHVNIKTGNIDFVPGTKYSLGDYGITKGSDGGSGDTYINFERSAQNLTSFTMSFSNAETAYTDSTTILGLRNEEDSSTYRLFTPHYSFNNNNTVGLIAKYDSVSSTEIPSVTRNNQLVAVGHVSEKNYLLAAMGVYQIVEGTYGPNALKSDKLTFYSNLNLDLKVGLSKEISVSGFMDAITSAEYTQLNSIFGAFRDAILAGK